MTVGAFTDSANRLTYVADSSTVSYTFNFDIADEDSIEVYVNNVLKSLTTDYSINFDSGTSGTGTVVFVSAPAASASIILKRDTNLIRTTDFQTNGSFTASAINDELDRLMQSVQEIDDKVENRVLRVDHFQTAPTDFTIPTTRSNQYLKFDGSGNITVTDDFTGADITVTGNVSVGGTLSVTGATTLSSLTASGNITGTLATAAQPQITSLGTLTSLTVDNLTLNDNQIASSTGTIALDDNVSVNGNVTATNLAGTLTTAAQTNITSLGTLSSVTIDDLTLNANDISSSTGTVDVLDNVSVAGDVTATGAVSANTLTGTLTTANQSNITNVGTLTSLDVDNININLNTISATTGNLTLSNVTSFTVDNINLDGNTISTSTGNLTLNPTSHIDANSNRIINLSDPTDNTDAATKGWVNTTLSNAGIDVGAGTTYQSKIENGSSRVEVVSSDGDVHIVNASTTLYKFEADEVEIDNPIRITKVGGYFSHRNTLDTGTFTTTAGYVSFMISPITINNGATVTISDGSVLRLI